MEMFESLIKYNSQLDKDIEADYIIRNILTKHSPKASLIIDI